MCKQEGDHLRRVVVLGAGGTGIQIAETVTRTGLEFLGFLDDDSSKRQEGYCCYPVLGSLCEWKRLPSDICFVSSLYGPKSQGRYCSLVESLQIPAQRWISLIDPFAAVSDRATIGVGAYVGPGSVVDPLVVVGTRCALLANVYIGHHSVLLDYVTCANSVSVAGGVIVGTATYVGANATVREYTTIGDNAVIGMGSVVLKDVPSGQTVVGNPARPIRL